MDTGKWISEVDAITAEFEREFGALNGDALNYKPSADVWSIAQNIDHLIVINKSYYPIIKQLHEGSFVLPFVGKIGFVVNMFGKMILKSVLPDRKKRMKTFAIWEPSKSKISDDIVTRFAAHQQSLKQLIRDSEELLEKGTVITSPANPKIVYKLETAFDILVTHERRHFEQANEVKQQQPPQS